EARLHGPRVGAVGYHDGAVVQLHVREEPLVAAQQPPLHELRREPHAQRRTSRQVVPWGVSRISTPRATSSSRTRSARAKSFACRASARSAIARATSS